MNALLLALTLSLTGMENTLDAPATLASELSEIAPRAMLNPAPFPTRMSLFDVEAPVEDPIPDLRPSVPATLCVAFVLPSLAELMNVEPLQSPVGFDVQPWLVAAPAKTPEATPSWLKDWSQR